MTMKLAFSTLGCPEWTWTEIYPMAYDLGYSGIEIRGSVKNHRSKRSLSCRTRLTGPWKRFKTEPHDTLLFVNCVLKSKEGAAAAPAEIGGYIRLARRSAASFVAYWRCESGYRKARLTTMLSPPSSRILQSPRSRRVTLLVESNGYTRIPNA
jgi:fatty-acyl-CoA synthase